MLNHASNLTTKNVNQTKSTQIAEERYLVDCLLCGNWLFIWPNSQLAISESTHIHSLNFKHSINCAEESGFFLANLIESFLNAYSRFNSKLFITDFLWSLIRRYFTWWIAPRSFNTVLFSFTYRYLTIFPTTKKTQTLSHQANRFHWKKRKPSCLDLAAQLIVQPLSMFRLFMHSTC